ncbi:HVA1 family protein [Rhodobacterales bacterium HKCCE4037]|nr:HVA1 family protein [Rhodobacterales bacterium HKCCE4037]
MASYHEGDKVEWDWGNGTATGTVQKTYTRKITRKLQGSEVTRDGSDDDPALYIEQDDGDGVLKLASEVRKA